MLIVSLWSLKDVTFIDIQSYLEPRFSKFVKNSSNDYVQKCACEPQSLISHFSL